MIKKITYAMALAMAVSPWPVSVAYADDRPFVERLRAAQTYGEQVYRRSLSEGRISQDAQSFPSRNAPSNRNAVGTGTRG